MKIKKSWLKGSHSFEVYAAGPNGRVHILCLQLLPDLFGVLDRSVDEEAQDLVAKPVLELFLHIPGTWVRGDRGIRRMSSLKACGQELAAE